eukprot:11624909-Karenia_brevis.AAC.1
MTSMRPRPPEVTEVETIQQGRREPKHKQLISLSEADWLESPQGQMSLVEMLTAAGFGVDMEQGHPATCKPTC